MPCTQRLRDRERSQMIDTRMSHLLFVSQLVGKGIPQSFHSSLWIFFRRMNSRHGTTFSCLGSLHLRHVIYFFSESDKGFFFEIENRWIKQTCKNYSCGHFQTLTQVKKREITPDMHFFCLNLEITSWPCCSVNIHTQAQTCLILSAQPCHHSCERSQVKPILSQYLWAFKLPCNFIFLGFCELYW